jgi:hypothetical protein
MDIRTSVITALEAQVSALQADLLANPVPASSAPVTPPAPQFVSQPLTAPPLVDFFQVGKSGATIVYGPTAVTYTPTIGNSVLLTMPTICKDFQVKGTMETVKQLQSGTANEPYDCGWLLFNFHTGTDGKPAYNYVSFKTNGVEVGLGYSTTGQTFLYTTSTPTFPVGKSFTFLLVKSGTNLSLTVNGTAVFTNESLDSSASSSLYNVPGQLALYCEDSEVTVSNVSLMVVD